MENLIFGKIHSDRSRNRSSEGLMKPCSARLCLSPAIISTGFAWGLFLKAMGGVGQLISAEQDRGGARLGGRKWKQMKREDRTSRYSLCPRNRKRVAQERWQTGKRGGGEGGALAPWP